MSLTALTTAPLIIQAHAASAILSLALGPFALLRQRRDRWHRALGYTWVVSMLMVAITSLFISENPMLGPFSLIHILSITTLAGLAHALRAALRRDFAAHGRAMRALYAQALIIPGVFTFLPGRRMNALFGSADDTAVFWTAATCGTALMLAIWLHPQLSRALGTRPQDMIASLFSARIS
jgi:uncharacterized membrane protein